jgi:transposase-like protein
MTDMNEVILKTDRRGRLRYTPEQKQALVEAYETSGLSCPRFAALHGVNYQTLVSWLKKRRQTEPDHPALRSLVPAELDGAPPRSDMSLPMEILLHAWADFWQELGKECDTHPSMPRTGANSSARQSDLDLTCRSGRRVGDGRGPAKQRQPQVFRSNGTDWPGFKPVCPTGTEWRFFRRISDKVLCRCLSFWATRKIH